MWVIRTPCQWRVSSAARVEGWILIVGIVFNPDLLPDYLKVLPDFDDIEAEDRSWNLITCTSRPFAQGNPKNSFEQSRDSPILSIKPEMRRVFPIVGLRRPGLQPVPPRHEIGKMGYIILGSVATRGKRHCKTVLCRIARRISDPGGIGHAFEVREVL